MTIDFPKFRKLLCHLRELLSGPCRIDYINGSDTFPPPLSKEEEQEVFAQLHAGSTEARETLIVHNLRLVVYIAKKFESSGLGLEDLISIGTIGLIKSIDNFDPTMEVKFSTYAVPMIAGEIRRFMRDDGMIKVSRSVKELGFKARNAAEELTKILGREPTIEEIAEKTGVSREEIAASLEAAAEVESLYKPLGNSGDKELLLMDRLEEEHDSHEELLNHLVLKELMEGLTDQHREIILRRYFYSQTQTQVAKALNISQVQVSRLEKRILKEMRKRYEEGSS